MTVPKFLDGVLIPLMRCGSLIWKVLCVTWYYQPQKAYLSGARKLTVRSTQPTESSKTQKSQWPIISTWELMQRSDFKLNVSVQSTDAAITCRISASSCIHTFLGEALLTLDSRLSASHQQKNSATALKKKRCFLRFSSLIQHPSTSLDLTYAQVWPIFWQRNLGQKVRKRLWTQKKP